MILADLVDCDNPNFLADATHQLSQFVRDAARKGQPIAETEQKVLQMIVSIGHLAMSQYLALQGDGDLGETVELDGAILQRSARPHARRIRTVFGEHVIDAFVYGRDLHRHTDFKPIDVRLGMPANQFSPLFQKISMQLGTEQAYNQAAQVFEMIFGSRISVNSLERIHQHASVVAEEFLYQAPIPAPPEEGEVLVVSGDAKGIPMIHDQPKRVMAFEERERPGNSQMATLAAVYSVDRFIRTPDQIVEALFREESETPPAKRPAPVGKVVVGCLVRSEAGEEPMAGDIQAFTWATEQVRRRHRQGQPIVRLMDGQATLWSTSTLCLEELEKAVAPIDVLDIIHVSTYVWKAAKVFHSHREHREAMVRDLLTRILEGGVGKVISRLRQRATTQRLSKKGRQVVESVCRYFENNRSRMRYDVYLREGYPIATGVIEGACRHLVKDRMCRTGMRWRPCGSQAMLNIRAVHQAGLADDFYTYRLAQEHQRQSKARKLLKHYQPRFRWE